jgi:hypothetical protein
MNALRSFYDADRTEDFEQPTAFQTERNQNEVYCGVCGDTFFVDDLVFEQISRAVENTMENPFVCEDCRSAYEEMEYSD